MKRVGPAIQRCLDAAPVIDAFDALTYEEAIEDAVAEAARDPKKIYLPPLCREI